MLRFFYLLFPTHFPHILFACSCLILIISCLHSYSLLQTFFSFMCSLTVYTYWNIVQWYGKYIVLFTILPTECYDSFIYFSPLIFLVYSLHAPTSCLLFLVYILISFYKLSFLLCASLLFMRSLMHSTITHAQSCTVCLHSLLTNA